VFETAAFDRSATPPAGRSYPLVGGDRSQPGDVRPHVGRVAAVADASDAVDGRIEGVRRVDVDLSRAGQLDMRVAREEAAQLDGAHTRHVHVDRSGRARELQAARSDHIHSEALRAY